MVAVVAMTHYLILTHQQAEELDTKLLLGMSNFFIQTGEDYAAEITIDCTAKGILIEWDDVRLGYDIRRK